MKVSHILSISAVTAAILLTGCSDDSKSNPAITAPDEVKQAVDLNQTTIQNVMAYIRYNVGGPSAPQKAVSNPGGGTNSGTETVDCTLGGTRTYSYLNTQEYETDGSYSYYDTWSNTYNNCIEPSTNSYTDFTATRYTQKGTTSNYYSSHYDANTSTNSYTNGGEDNYTAVYDNNESDTGLSSYTVTRKSTAAYTYDNLTKTNTQNRNGERSYLDRNATGDIVNGYKDIWDRWSMTSVNMPEHEQVNANGSYTRTNYSTDGSSTLSNADYFVNFEFSAVGGDDHNISVSGKAGSLCLGGSVSFATNPIVREDQVSYMDENNATGGNVLPYSGTLTVTGTSSATVVFDNNTTHSEAVVHIGDTNTTYGSWSTLANGPCGGII